MNTTDRAPLVAIALLAARADGQSQDKEKATIDAVVERIGAPDVSRLTEQVASGQVQLSSLASRLSDDEARRLAYETALAVCHADGALNPGEQKFLDELRQALGLSGAQVQAVGDEAAAIATTPMATATTPLPDDATLDKLILQQAILTGALEILPDRLANIAVLPLQMRLVYQVGQHHGQTMDGNQVKDLIA
ncbi:MAG: tellurite resistance TerB family protein, partial [Gemmatimonadota bacterium]